MFKSLDTVYHAHLFALRSRSIDRSREVPHVLASPGSSEVDHDEMPTVFKPFTVLGICVLRVQAHNLSVKHLRPMRSMAWMISARETPNTTGKMRSQGMPPNL